MTLEIIPHDQQASPTFYEISGYDETDVRRDSKQARDVAVRRDSIREAEGRPSHVGSGLWQLLVSRQSIHSIPESS